MRHGGQEFTFGPVRALDLGQCPLEVGGSRIELQLQGVAMRPNFSFGEFGAGDVPPGSPIDGKIGRAHV